MVLEMQDRSLDTAAEQRDRIATGSVVRLKDPNGTEEWEVMIVSTHQADPDADHISDECPVGEALLGRRAGDIIRVEVPLGIVHYRVVSVEPPWARFSTNGQRQ